MSPPFKTLQSNSTNSVNIILNFSLCEGLRNQSAYFRLIKASCLSNTTSIVFPISIGEKLFSIGEILFSPIEIKNTILQFGNRISLSVDIFIASAGRIRKKRRLSDSFDCVWSCRLPKRS